MNKTGFLLSILIVSMALAQDPVVQNIEVVQRTDGSFIVDMYFDVADIDGDTLEISVAASSDGGQTWRLPCDALTGDVGTGILPGTGKHIVWDFYQDNPHISCAACRLRITADDHRNEITDIDGNSYRTIQIGGQVWMAENLRVTHYRNGDAIPYIYYDLPWTELTSGGYCAYNNSETLAETYGYLYNWYAVTDSRNIAPPGWHVPTDEEWKTLEIYLGMSRIEADSADYYRGTDEGGKLKEPGIDHWYNPNTGATNETGFTAIPGGCRLNYDGRFDYKGYDARFWTSTEGKYTTTAWFRVLNTDYAGIRRCEHAKRRGFSVRLVRD